MVAKEWMTSQNPTIALVAVLAVIALALALVLALTTTVMTLALLVVVRVLVMLVLVVARVAGAVVRSDFDHLAAATASNRQVR